MSDLIRVGWQDIAERYQKYSEELEEKLAASESSNADHVARTEARWREAVILAERWFESSRVNHHSDCKQGGRCNCGVRSMLEKFSALLSLAPAAEGTKP